MKRLWLLPLFLVVAPQMAIAQSYQEPARFDGLKAGVAIDYRWLKGEYDLPRVGGGIDDRHGGVGYHGFVGYDAQIGESLVVGIEGGAGRGGKTIRTQSQTADYSLKPGWNWDVSARAGVLPAPNVLLYGRVGYGWQRVREITDFRATNLQDINATGTEKGVMWGGGIETRAQSGMFARAEYKHTNYGSGLSASTAQLGVGVGF